MSKIKSQNFKSKFKIRLRSKRWMTFGIIFVAGLGLGALAVGTVWVRAYQSYTTSPVYTTNQADRANMLDEADLGFRDPLITLVKPTAGYRPETPFAPEVRESDPVW